MTVLAWVPGPLEMAIVAVVLVGLVGTPLLVVWLYLRHTKAIEAFQRSDTKVCPACRAEMPGLAPSCPSCGKPMEFCPTCGKPL